jgi:carbohydrate kinase (thermoresistant glucokinase family)
MFMVIPASLLSTDKRQKLPLYDVFLSKSSHRTYFAALRPPRRQARRVIVTTDGGGRRVVLIGVSGSGKTAVGSALAARLGWRFIDADDLHPPASIAKMSAGAPLTDDDRRPWLAEVARQLALGHDTIAACSALRRSYRTSIADAVPEALFVHLAVPAATLAARMQARGAHFMPVSLLDSQLATFEPLGPDERGVSVDASRELGTVVTELAGLLTHLVVLPDAGSAPGASA